MVQVNVVVTHDPRTVDVPVAYAVAWYRVIAEAPGVSGAIHDTTIVPTPAAAVTDRGTDGVAAGTAEVEAEGLGDGVTDPDGVPQPCVLRATTLTS